MEIYYYRQRDFNFFLLDVDAFASMFIKNFSAAPTQGPRTGTINKIKVSRVAHNMHLGDIVTKNKHAKSISGLSRRFKLFKFRVERNMERTYGIWRVS